MAKVLSSAAAPARRAVPAEGCIFAYCNVKTNQVLYSLTPGLQPSHLKQLPDIGANQTPPSLRKDMWRPLWRVQFRQTPHSKQQTLHAFKKLREWRKLHELCWEPTEEMRRPFTEIQIERLQTKLDQRGGSKKETVYNLIKRQKRKMRIAIIRNQKANSIADLAAVLKEQAKLGLETPSLQGYEGLEEYKLTDVRDILNRAYTAPMVQARLNNVITKLQEKLVTLKQQPDADDAKTKRKHLRDIQKKQNSLEATKRYLSKVQWYAKVVAQAKVKAAQDGKGNTEPAVAGYLPQTSPHTPKALRIALAKLRRNPKDAPRRGWVAREVQRRLRPRFDTEGIRISWFNLLDKEFAAEWPEHVKHDQFPDVSSHRVAGPRHVRSRNPIASPAMTKITNAVQNLALQSVRSKAVAEQWDGRTQAEYWKAKGKVVDLDGTPSRFVRRFRDQFQRQRAQVASRVSQ